MVSLALTRAQARRFLLEKHGLWDEYRFGGAAGVAAFVRQAGCVQFDPVDACGQNAQLVLLSRVADFRKSLLDEALYGRRALLDYWDKNMAILPMEEWPFLARERAAQAAEGRSRAAVEGVRPQLLAEIASRGPLCARDLDYGRTDDWYWSGTSVARAALETLYFRGELCVHHKAGGVKYYDLAERCVPPALLRETDGLSDEAYLRRRVLRRIAAVGLLWDRRSDAWLGIRGLDARTRAAVFAALRAEGAVIEARAEGLDRPLYAAAEDEALLRRCAAWDGAGEPARCELLGPLDSLLWDRNLVRALFGFSYTWEIYTVPEKRVYGWYVLPVLLDGALRGRIEPVRDPAAGRLRVRGLWWEPGFRPTAEQRRRLRGALGRLAAMNGLRPAPEREWGR